ncbi:bifunctional diaminohydroxyphosphoribosylaminopyrimidine deaminase/5-amino-6-(5-phosphoribosylamino)uracil reductase RibD [Moritella sp. Urea-trap-13]|uniref:bifunctional diaminohydroxyphosphoribosylaminopyrimidine deaminase/5-amino-6-(5-phosphoribosylamino)uracil reductase RibD n=1 Tax=Moritella sp. Urea-trap-13 TaxID=2058327 RepID=UPI000C3461BC|nr:bifunctional diaminohydroxyphosphoribosylaminopyrimidine deaminase/5-amino-6-(5-phosphoribosylamino)uracil reductase RibD [Moritella sp. Urea-trap-13]PKH05363.1 bifunctional diaminohydroxyphosphoribosylaminopyrimidine deaminase/5-amino-6-(5-phosphoribosylamino)uracil reductase RibD [Moritella sp. Urea-trap-13]
MPIKSRTELNRLVATLASTSQFNDTDVQHMQRAIALAKQGRFTSAPNPNVGCVLVKAEQIVGEGFHLRAGEPHAEIHALNTADTDAHGAAHGATCYVTLEPCSHYGRTPPCAAALVKAQVAEVVIAMVDPNPKVAGNGIAMLIAAGIKVRIGLLSEQAHALNPGFILRMREQRPFVRLKMAASLDGRTALNNGESKWITGPAARSDVQVYRAQANAILSTASTVMMDDASLNVRYSELGASQADYPLDDTFRGLLAEQLDSADKPLAKSNQSQVRQPIRVILDNHRRLDAHMASSAPALQLFAQPGQILLVNGIQNIVNGIENNANGVADNPATAAILENESVSRIEIGQDSLHNIDLNQLMTTLAQQDINELWVEAGATLAGALLENKLVDEIIIYLAPKLMGDCARGLAVLSELTEMAQVPKFSFTDITQVGDDLRITAKPEY